MAPAEAPPMLRNRYDRAISHTANGYTTPLVIPPFMTMSQHCVGAV
jgi:hypothetical protein